LKGFVNLDEPFRKGSLMAEYPTLVDPPIEELLSAVGGSKFSLVAVAAVRARAITNYFNGLGRGDGKIEPPQVSIKSNKSLSFAFEELAEHKLVFNRLSAEQIEEAKAKEAAMAAELAASTANEFDALLDDNRDA
jgi:DNA-directed RNA polymerase omega subunit